MKKKSASKSAFFKLRVLVGVLLAFAAITVVLFALGKASAQPRTAPGISQPTISAQYRGVMPVVKFDISPPLRDMVRRAGPDSSGTCRPGRAGSGRAAGDG